MARKVRQVNSVLSTQSLSSTTAKARKIIFKILTIIIVCYVVCGGPRWTFLFVYFFCNVAVDFGGVPYNVSLVLTYTNCCVSPVIYLLKYEEFQKVFISLRLSFKRGIYACFNYTNMPKTKMRTRNLL